MNKPKLVRDRIPEIIEAKGQQSEWRRVDSQSEHREWLTLKLAEELDEYMTSETPEARIAELADVSEVIHSFAVIDDYLDEHVEQMRLARISQMGEPDLKSKDAAVNYFSVLCDELLATPSSSKRLETLAELLQCVHAFSVMDGVRQEEVEKARRQKRHMRGSFIGGVVLLNW